MGGKQHYLPIWGLRYIWEREKASKKGCVETEDWGFSVHFLCIGVPRKFHLHYTLMF